MRKSLFKGINILGNLLNLGLLILFMWGSATYAPDSKLTVLIWLVGFGVFLYLVFDVICRISDYTTMRRINNRYR